MPATAYVSISDHLDDQASLLCPDIVDVSWSQVVLSVTMAKKFSRGLYRRARALSAGDIRRLWYSNSSSRRLAPYCV